MKPIGQEESMRLATKTVLVALVTLSPAVTSSCSTTATGPTTSPMTTEVFSVKDLLFARAAHPHEVPPESSNLELAALVNNLKEATSPEYWQQDGTQIRSEDSGYLAVTATTAMQRQIAQVLAEMRRFPGRR
jgi:hypothetical protein